MATVIRMKRVGRKNRPFFRIVVQDQRSAPSGRVIEIVGTHDPMQDPCTTKIKAERVQEWLRLGAIPSDTVKSLIKKANIQSAANER